MRKYWPLLAAVLVGLVIFVALRPEAQTTVIVAARALPAGHTLTVDDLTTRDMPDSMVPAGTALSATGLLGQTIKVDIASGDMIRKDHLGEPVELGPEERGITIQVDDATGLGGILNPGDTVGIVAVIFGQNNAYSKVTVENLRVLWISPEFRRGFTAFETDTVSGASVTTSQDRSSSGVVLVAVPADWMVVKYDFTNIDPAAVPPTERKISVLELLSSLNTAGNARVQMYLMPKDASGEVKSSGFMVNDLILIPSPTNTPAPTATLRPGETREAPEITPTPTPQP